MEIVAMLGGPTPGWFRLGRLARPEPMHGQVQHQTLSGVRAARDGQP